MVLKAKDWKYFFNKCDEIIGEKMTDELNEYYDEDILLGAAVRQLLEKLKFDEYEDELLCGSYTVDEIIQYKKELDDELAKLIWLTYFFD